jgi:hypothetical protein
MQPEVRLRVLNHLKGLVAACTDDGRRGAIMLAATQRCYDKDDALRAAAAAAFCAIAAERPELARDMAALEPLLGRLRDKKVAVRKEVATHVSVCLCWGGYEVCFRVTTHVSGSRFFFFFLGGGGGMRCVWG